MPLPADVTRCMGIDPDKRHMCPDRHLCQRHYDADPWQWQPWVWTMREPGRECEYMMGEGE